MPYLPRSAACNDGYGISKMILEKIIPDIFKGLPVSAFFTTRAFHADLVTLKDQLQAEAVYLPIQKHTGKVIILEYDLEPQIADAVVTNRKGVAIGVQVADCVPILLYDTKKQVAGAVHAGWRGTAEGIARKTIAVLRDRFYSSPEDIVLAIGPGIRGSCYEVGDEVLDAVTKATGEGDYIFSRGEKHYVDLPAANRLQALSEGVLPGNIWMSDDCTHCLPDKYYSYRYSKGAAGRQYAYVSIR
jgi:hypothetical protein